MIKISNASKRYEELEAVKNVNMQVNKGLIFGLIGSTPDFHKKFFLLFFYSNRKLEME